MPALVSRDDCCFGALPIKTATYIVGVIELIFAITGLFMAVGAIAHNYEHATLMNKIIFALQIVYFLLYIFLTILLFFGLRNNQVNWIFMHLQASACIAICMLVYVVLVALAHYWYLLIYYIIIAVVMIFFVYVEYCCFQHMRG